jgi:hypothetical protein
MRRMIAILLSLAALGLSSCQCERLKETSPRRYYLAQSEAPPSDNPAAPFSAHSLGALGYQFFARREPSLILFRSEVGPTLPLVRHCSPRALMQMSRGSYLNTDNVGIVNINKYGRIRQQLNTVVSP